MAHVISNNPTDINLILGFALTFQCPTLTVLTILNIYVLGNCYLYVNHGWIHGSCFCSLMYFLLCAMIHKFIYLIN